MNGVLGKRALKELGARANDAAGSGYSSVAQRMMKRMGWEEGAGLGKEGQGMASYIKVQRKDDDAGLGHDKAERESAAKQWYFSAFEDAIAAAHHLDPKLKKKLKKDKKGKDKKKKEVDEATIYQEMFEKSGGARMGMRARASQKAKWERTSDFGARVATAPTQQPEASPAEAPAQAQTQKAAGSDDDSAAATVSSSEESGTDYEAAAAPAEEQPRRSKKRRRTGASEAAGAADEGAESAQQQEESGDVAAVPGAGGKASKAERRARREERRARKAAKRARRKERSSTGADVSAD